MDLKIINMKKVTFLLLTIFTVATLYSQSYEIDFAGTGDTTIVDSVQVKNLNQETSITLMGNDILQLNVNPPDGNAIDYTTSDFGSLQVYPNPMSEQATIKFFVNTCGNVRVAVYDLSGKTVGQSTQFLLTGNHTYSIKGLSQGIYLVQVNEQNDTYVAKLASMNNLKEEVKIVYDCSENIALNKNQSRDRLLKSATSTIEMSYNEGDRLLFTGMSGNYATIVTDVPTGDKTITFDFINCMDADSNYYPVVIIGTQTWMAKNLKTTKYNDNTSIQGVTDNTTWANSTTPAYCWYHNNEAIYKNLYGALYNWHTVDTGNFCPVGWHVPSDDEWKTLEMYMGMSQSDADAQNWRGADEGIGGKLKESGTEHWASPNTGATNESGFSALPSGFRHFNDGSYWDLRKYAAFWSSTEYSSNSAWYRTLYFYRSDIERYYDSKGFGGSVRCVKD
jgi:uncharacterized protein (TIGR02145 family)